MKLTIFMASCISGQVRGSILYSHEKRRRPVSPFPCRISLCCCIAPHLLLRGSISGDWGRRCSGRPISDPLKSSPTRTGCQTYKDSRWSPASGRIASLSKTPSSIFSMKLADAICCLLSLETMSVTSLRRKQSINNRQIDNSVLNASSISGTHRNFHLFQSGL